ncbi:MAG TPA: four helix bundle protein [Chthoniobacterales bacterium]|nr:four helix bundle protein [Chthoniobacterales bacterium]
MKRNGRVKEESGVDYGEALKGRTSNVQRPTSNVQRREESATAGSERRFDLEERLLEYAVRIIRLVDALPATRAGRHVADQLLRCGTSPLANHGELQGAESRKDFIHKLKICLKEIREARRWLRLVHRVPLLAPPKIDPLIAETEALIKIFAASIRTAEKNKG